MRTQDGSLYPRGAKGWTIADYGVYAKQQGRPIGGRTPGEHIKPEDIPDDIAPTSIRPQGTMPSNTWPTVTQPRLQLRGCWILLASYARCSSFKDFEICWHGTRRSLARGFRLFFVLFLKVNGSGAHRILSSSYVGSPTPPLHTKNVTRL